MQPDAKTFTVRQCERVKAEWYVDGPWDDSDDSFHVDKEEIKAFRHKPFPQAVAEDIAKCLNMSIDGLIGFKWIERWLSDQSSEVRQIVLSEYKPI